MNALKTNSKIIKAHCKNTGQYFVIEAEKDGFTYFATSIKEITQKEAETIKSEVTPLALQTSSKLPKCKICGSRKVGHGHGEDHVCECGKTKGDKQCIYCGGLTYDAVGVSAIAVKKKFDKKIRVSSPGYDNVGEVLTALNIKWEPFNGNYDCDILFLNCLTDDSIDNTKLKKFCTRWRLRLWILYDI